MSNRAERKRRALRALRAEQERARRDRASSKRRTRKFAKREVVAKRRKRGRVPREIKLQLYELSQKCMYCGIELLYREVTIDHVIPLSKGGSTTIENLAIACQPCNSYKGDRILSPSGSSELNLVVRDVVNITFGEGIFDE